MNKRELSAANTKKRIIEAASILIKEYGLEHISVDDITRKAAVAKGSFYTYFKKKEDVVETVCHQNFAGVTSDVYSTGTTVVEKTVLYMKGVLTSVVNCGLGLCKSWISNTLLGEPSQHVSKLQADLQTYQSILHGCTQDGTLRYDAPIESISQTVISQIYGLMLTWCMSNGSINPVDAVEQNQIRQLFQQYIK